MRTVEMILKLQSGEHVDQMEVAAKLIELMIMVDNMRNDHYVDTLEWYAERCWELEEEVAKLKG